MINIKEDITRIIDEYKELELKIIETSKELNFICTEEEYLGFIFDEENDEIIIKIEDINYELDNDEYKSFPINCLFSKYAIEEFKKNIPN